MKQKLLLTILISSTLSISNIIAQNNTTDDIQLFDSIVGDLPESLDNDLLELLEEWHAKHFSNSEDYCIDENENPFFSDSVYELRIKQMPFVVPVTYNETVRRCIDLYSTKLRNKLKYIMGMADFYFPMIEQKLDAEGLPLELKYLAVVESALNPVAQSHVGAYGLWQFMLPTGKIYGLEINSLIDERLDPEKATDAACKYFHEMYEIYGNWHLVIAAYNCGPGNVNKAIKRSGGYTDFWKIYPYLPRETRSYVPLFMAAAYILTYHCDHNICPRRADFAVATDTLIINKTLHFEQIADILNMDKEAVRFYNPQYKREIIPGNMTPSILRLPVGDSFSYIEKSDTIHAHRYDELLSNVLPVDPSDKKGRQETISHTVEAGETVYTVANKYGVTTQNLRKWNGLKGSRLQKGRKLKVIIDNGGLTYTASKTATKIEDSKAQTLEPSKNKAGTTSKAHSSDQKNTNKTTSYKVKSGDTLYEIAKRYPGVTAKSIQLANGLRNTNLRIGQILIIPTG